MKTILLFGAGKSATVLIDYLSQTAADNNWKFIVADANKEQILAKTGSSRFTEAAAMDINDEIARGRLIERAHVVISMMPAALHFLIAKDCVEYRKHLLTASYVDDDIKSLRDEINHRKLLFLCEMGLDPGIDHMSAMRLIDTIKNTGGNITSFKSHCGGLVAPECDDNPWHYKISWNPRNVVLAGKAGAVYKEKNSIVSKEYRALFNNCEEVQIPGLGELAFYPNRDSLGYMPVYKLSDAETFMRTTLRYPIYCRGWDALVNAGLCDDTEPVDTAVLSFKNRVYGAALNATPEIKNLLIFLGLFDDAIVPETAKTSADILQYLLEIKLAMKPSDKDMIVMLHEIEYENAGIKYKSESSLVVKGDNNVQTAMAKTVGLPLGIAATLLLNGTLTKRGLHIPVSRDIYEPVLAELEKMEISFNETTVALH